MFLPIAVGVALAVDAFAAGLFVGNKFGKKVQAVEAAAAPVVAEVAPVVAKVEQAAAPVVAAVAADAAKVEAAVAPVVQTAEQKIEAALAKV